MRHRAAKACLLAGWLVMVPKVLPGPNDQETLNADAPVTSWRQYSAHDDAASCETQIVAVRQLFHDLTAKDPASWWSMTYAKCVPAEYLYPPAKVQP